MIEANNATLHPQADSLTTRMIIGAGIGLLLISVFIIPAEANPAWGKFWMIRPLIVTPLTGAMTGLCSHFLINFHHRFGINKTVAIILNIIGPVLGMFIGLVLGMDGTLWD